MSVEQNRIHKKLFVGEDKEIKLSKIELSVIDDIDKETSKAVSSMLNGSKNAQRAIKEYNDAAQAYATAEGLASRALGQAKELGANQLSKEISKKISNLGRDLKRANSIAAKMKSLM